MKTTRTGFVALQHARRSVWGYFFPIFLLTHASEACAELRYASNGIDPVTVIVYNIENRGRMRILLEISVTNVSTENICVFLGGQDDPPDFSIYVSGNENLHLVPGGTRIHDESGGPKQGIVESGLREMVILQRGESVSQSGELNLSDFRWVSDSRIQYKERPAPEGEYFLYAFFEFFDCELLSESDIDFLSSRDSSSYIFMDEESKERLQDGRFRVRSPPSHPFHLHPRSPGLVERLFR